MVLDKEIEKILNEPNPQADAVNSLIKVEKRTIGDMDSDIEIKTDLSEKEVNAHVIVDLIHSLLEMAPSDFAKHSILGDLVNKRERKLLSKDRKSRTEIVEIARHPDTANIISSPMQSQGAVQKFFRPHK